LLKTMKTVCTRVIHSVPRKYLNIDISIVPRPSSFNVHKTLLLLSIVFLCYQPMVAQTLSFKHYTDDVLQSSVIYAAFQDSNGFMWFASDRGMSRYDGYSFTKYGKKDGVPDSEVYSFMEDSQHRMWLQTSNGKVAYYKDGMIYNSDIDHTLKPLDSHSLIVEIKEDGSGNIWIMTYTDGVVVLRKDGTSSRFRILQKNQPIATAIFTAKNELLVVTYSDLLMVRFTDNLDSIASVRREASKWLVYGYPSMLALENGSYLLADLGRVRSIDSNTLQTGIFYDVPGSKEYVYNILADDEYIWICTSNGVVPYLKSRKKFLPRILPDHKIAYVLKDDEGSHWFATMGHGVFYSVSFNMFGLTEENGLPSARVNCMAKDKQNRLWIGYEGQGAITYLKNGKANTFAISHPSLSEKIITHDIYCVDDRQWLATTEGNYLIEKEKVTMTRAYGKRIIEYKDMIWHATGAVLFKVTAKAFYKYRLSGTDFHYTPEWIKKGEIGGRKSVIIDTVVGLQKCFFIDKDSMLWISTDQSLYKTDGDKIEAITVEHEGSRVVVNAFTQLADSTFVMATADHGVIFFKDGKIIDAVTEAEGLSSNSCFSVALDNSGNIWVAGSYGLNKITGYPEKTTVNYFSANDGLFSNELSDVVVIGDTVYTCSKKGINFFHVDAMKKNSKPPKIIIDVVTVHSKKVNGPSRHSPVFQHSENDISIKYWGLSYHTGADILYRYKLHEEDPWRYTRNTSVYLPQLASDHYTFTVSAKTPFSDWSSDAAFAFTIDKPFWETHLFRISIAVFLASLIWAGVDQYIRDQKKKMQWEHRVTISELRSLRAQMNPHFLFNALNSIKGTVLKNNMDKAEDDLDRFSKLMRLILDHSDKNTVTIAEEIEALTLYLEFERYKPQHQFQYSIVVSPAIDVNATEVPAMILQPFIENAIWHGFVEKNTDHLLQIEFAAAENGSLTIAIRDNGIGRRKAQAQKNGHPYKSKGIQLVKERIDTLNFKKEKKISLDIQDLVDETGNDSGTLVILTIPGI
jgi:hypothetical protein